MTNGTSQGLFVIVAIVIFGIFVSISYIIFNKEMKTGLTAIYCDTFNMVSETTGLGTFKECIPPIEVKTPEGGNTFTGKDFDASGDLKDVEFKFSKVTGGGVNITPSAKDKNKKLTDFEIPDIVNGEKVTSVSGFGDMTFTGEFNKPKYLEKVSTDAFKNSKFTGNIDMTGITSVGDRAFSGSNFTGDFIANDLNSLGTKAFENSKFDGKFEAVKLKIIPDYAFYNAKFTGAFDVNDINKIGKEAFRNSLFDGHFTNTNSLTSIGESAFYSSLFVGDFRSLNLEKIEDNTFYNSKFDGLFFTGNKLTTVSFDAFRNSPFRGHFTSNNIRYLKYGSFYSSKFSGYSLKRMIGGDYESYFGKGIDYKTVSYY